VVYAVVGVAALAAGGPDLLASSTSPLASVLSGADRESVEPVVRVGATLASLGALLALMTGIGRTALAMARERDLPHWLAAVHPTYRVPHRAEVALAVVVAALVLTTDLRGALGFSSFGVLIYYAVANASAFTQPATDRRWPRALQVVGLLGCLTLAFALPAPAVLVGLAVLALGVVGRAVRRVPTGPSARGR
jgi:APA family basic amino acid/polyamine antiporter